LAALCSIKGGELPEWLGDYLKRDWSVELEFTYFC